MTATIKATPRMACNASTTGAIDQHQILNLLGQADDPRLGIGVTAWM